MKILPFREPKSRAVVPKVRDQIQFKTIHGYRRAFIYSGQGPALLLIHGIGDNSATWRPVLSALAERFTVVAPDLLGHGKSDKPRADYSVAGYANAMRDLLSVLGIEQATVVGHSLGGGVAMQFAYQFPDRCERLVLVSTGGVSREVHWGLRLASLQTSDLVLPSLRFGPVRGVGRAFLRSLAALGTDIGHDAEDLVRIFDALPDATARAAFTRTLRAVVDYRGQVVTMLDRCYLTRGMPALLMWGGRDAIIPAEHARVAHAAMPGSRLEIFPQAAHFPHHDDPEHFLSVLTGFIDSTKPASFSTQQWRQLLRNGRQAAPFVSVEARTEEMLSAAVPSGT